MFPRIASNDDATKVTNTSLKYIPVTGHEFSVKLKETEKVNSKQYKVGGRTYKVDTQKVDSKTFKVPSRKYKYKYKYKHTYKFKYTYKYKFTVEV